MVTRFGICFPVKSVAVIAKVQSHHWLLLARTVLRRSRRISRCGESKVRLGRNLAKKELNKLSETKA